MAAGGVLPRQQLSEDVAAHIREMIMSGAVRPGEFLRLERIADELGTSVTPVREALLTLRGEDMVDLLPRRGYVVADLSRQDVVDLFDVQIRLAGELVARACTRLDAEQLADLRGVQQRLAEAAAAGAVAELRELEYAFHRAINRAADSRKLAFLLHNTSRYLPQRFYASDTGWRSKVVRDHRKILRALTARDPEAARTAMADHVADGAQRLIKHLASQGFWD